MGISRILKDKKIIMTGLGGKQTKAVQTKIDFKIEQLPRRNYSVMTVPIPEYIIGFDIVAGMTLNLEAGRYQFGVQFVTGISCNCEKVNHAPLKLLAVTKLIQIKQYQIPEGQTDYTRPIRGWSITYYIY